METAFILKAIPRVVCFIENLGIVSEVDITTHFGHLRRINDIGKTLVPTGVLHTFVYIEDEKNKKPNS